VFELAGVGCTGLVQTVVVRYCLYWAVSPVSSVFCFTDGIGIYETEHISMLADFEKNEGKLSRF